MWIFLISSIASSIIGSAADSWFADTKLGKWFYKKVDDVASWASKKLGLKVLQDEDKAVCKGVLESHVYIYNKLRVRFGCIGGSTFLKI